MSVIAAIPPELAGQRLDKALAALLPHLTRSRIQQLIESGDVVLAGAPATSASRKVKAGESYHVTEPAPEPLDLQPLDLPLDIVFEDAHLLVINKPSGLTVHPAAGNRTHTLVNALLHHCGDSLSGIGGVARPGIVHRIDKDTSGLLVVAKTDSAHQHLAAQLKARTLKRDYVAYVWHAPKRGQGTVDAPIARHPTKRKEMAIVEGGRHAVTHYTVEMNYAGLAAKLHCALDTGRTHQIRIHMKHIGCPMVGDPVYGLSSKQTLSIIHKGGIISESETEKIVMTLSRQALHARMLRFDHPVSGQAMQFTAPLPEDLQALETALATLHF